MKETELASLVIDYMRGLKWDAYQEVQGPGGRADIVLTQGPFLGVVETKRHMELRLLEQAQSWTAYSHLTWAAVWKPKRNHSFFLTDICRTYLGIGLLLVSKRKKTVAEVVKPKLQRKAMVGQVRRLLEPEHKHFAEAGNDQNQYWSPFKRTVREIQNLVMDKPGIRLGDAVRIIQHHYTTSSTARNCIATWLRKGIIDGVEAHLVGRHLELYPTGHPSTILLNS
jgi:hypothetical protein